MIPSRRDYPLAPDVPAGLELKEPDLVCIGAQRCGTTRVAVFFATHPDFHYPDYLKGVLKPTSNQFLNVKERHFFERTHTGLTDDQIAEYRKWFPRPPGKKTGEFTPRYMYDYWVAEQLYAAAPTTKILVMLRDPVERFWSGCQFSGNVEPATFNEHFQRGLYAAQLAEWYRYFPRDQVLVVQYEQFNITPRESFAEICRFVGIDDTQSPKDEQVEAKVNAGQPRPQLTEEVKKSLRDAYLADVEALTKLAPNIDIKLWKNFA